jgi:hypothetical protein
MPPLRLAIRGITCSGVITLGGYSGGGGIPVSVYLVIEHFYRAKFFKIRKIA